ncbi:unnamed protein product [Scytosiphon promiscuus]
MMSSHMRETLRGEEATIFDLAAKYFTEEQWGEWLKGPLEHAAGYGPSALALKLARAGANVGQALDVAVWQGREDVVSTLLVERGAYTGTGGWDGEKLLHRAAALDEPGADSIMRALLQAAEDSHEGADKDAFNQAEFTPLHIAAKYGHASLVGVLLSAGADASIRCEQPFKTWVRSDAKLVGLSTLDVAATKGHVDVMGVMLEHGVDPNLAHSSTGSTALHHVTNAPSGMVAAIKLLVDAGVNVNKQTVHGETALHWAAIGGAGSGDAVDALLRCGADETLLDTDGMKAVDGVGCFEPDTDDDDEDEAPNEEELKRMETLLMNAPADRVWRRRGMLVLCRAFPDRLQSGQISSLKEGVPDRTCVRAKGEIAGTGSADGGNSNNGGTGGSGEWRDTAGRLVMIKEDEMFRSIMGYL